MSNKFIPHTPDDISRMMEAVGIRSLDELYGDIPAEVIFNRDYLIPSEMSEVEIRRHFDELASKNHSLKVFAGGGVYDHYAPSVIPHLLSRSEFYTAYTPYQPEISQGTLQYIFEYQSIICELTGMEVTNASMYDGATATAEAMFMMVASAKKRNRVLLSATLRENVVEVVKTYAKFRGIDISVVPEHDGVTDLEALKAELAKDDVAGVILPQPNKYGIIEDLSGVAEAVHAAKAQLALHADPSTLAVLKTPAEWGADIACGDGQSLGMPMQFGGPYLGFIATGKGNIRKIPGRVVGATKDADGKRAFVLTLQAREQHIRREKATSNICSNQSLMSLYATIYVALMGKQGMVEVNALSADGASYLHDRLLATGLFEEAFPGKPFLKEFALKSSLDAPALEKHLAGRGFMGGIPMADGLFVFAVTEKRSREEIDAFVNSIVDFAK